LPAFTEKERFATFSLVEVVAAPIAPALVENTTIPKTSEITSPE